VRIAVCAPQVPFVRGGAEILTQNLVDQLRRREHEAELVTIPFKWYPRARVLTEALLWRLADLEESEGRPIDLVIATKFPSYAVRHPNKVVWLIHQFRQAYEMDGTPLGQFGPDPFDRATRRAIHRLDQVGLGESQKLFAISQNVAMRLRTGNGLEAEVLRPPPQQLDYRCEEYGDFVLSVGRLDRAKRVDLLVQAVAVDPRLKAVVVGEGPDGPRLEELVHKLGLEGRLTFAGRVERDELARLYATCLAVFYAPVDEDLGFVPYEAFLSQKPVVSTNDAGGPLEVVSDQKTGLVCEPEPAAVARAVARLASSHDEARAWGRSGMKLAEQASWDNVVDRLLSA
jgi:glycosyltransferase involved in cell wall biosynthesis